MTSFLSQHRHEFSDGMVVERLPLGFAAGRWWATFVYAAPESGEAPVDWRDMRQSASVDAVDGGLAMVGGSGGGGALTCQQTLELIDRGAVRARSRYFEDDVEVGSESLTLDATDRTGHFAARLADGSVIERLPVGHAHGRCHLRWVRSEIPAADRETDDDDLDQFAPHHRFIRLRSPQGSVEPVGASGTIGGAIQAFSIEVPDTEKVLQVDYLLDGELVVSEPLSLPEPHERPASR